MGPTHALEAVRPHKWGVLQMRPKHHKSRTCTQSTRASHPCLKHCSPTTMGGTLCIWCFCTHSRSARVSGVGQPPHIRAQSTLVPPPWEARASHPCSRQGSHHHGRQGPHIRAQSTVVPPPWEAHALHLVLLHT
eukprot:1161971-Pelagomonas_calceolata.AAC.1